MWEQFSRQAGDKWSSLLTVVLLCASVVIEPAAADFSEGRRLLDNGEPARAVEVWRYSGWVEDDFRSQVTLGDFYDEGTYVVRDPVEAYVWYYLALINQTGLGRTKAAEQGQLVAQKHVLEHIDRLAFPMSAAERIDANQRIVYILSSRGADGFFKLGELLQDSSAHKLCEGKTVGSQEPYLWLYCEQSTANDGFNVISKNHVESFAYFILAEKLGDTIANATADSYANILYSRFTQNDACATATGAGFPRSCRHREFYNNMMSAAQKLAQGWTPPFEVYPGGHTDQSDDQVEDIAALNRIEKLNMSSIQEALAFLGFYQGAIDNAYGPMTRGAMKKYQASIGAQITGEMTPRQRVELIRKVADAGHANTQNALGTMYFRGLGVVQDYPQARTWFDKAEAQKHPYAMMNLGIIYRDGLGVQNDDQKAAIYFMASRDEFRRRRGNFGHELKLLERECAKLVGQWRCTR